MGASSSSFALARSQASVAGGDPLAPFHPAVQAWFRATFGTPSPPQALGWPPISAGQHTLILAPTGSGKTLAAFLWCLNYLYTSALAGQELAGVQVVYVSPLKALNNDVHRNLEVPLRGIARQAQRLGYAWPEVRAMVRTGDTTPSDRRAMVRRPPHVLITTPESLYLLLTGAESRRILRDVRYVIVDEVHALAGNKRGVHLALTLERLEHLVATSRAGAPFPDSPADGSAFVRIGLSATQRPLEEIAAFLGGLTAASGDGVRPLRPVTIVDAGARRQLDLAVVSPVEDFTLLGPTGVWPHVYPLLLDLIRSHRSTLIFVNNRALAERLTAKLNELAGEELVRTHHGSIARERRHEVEALLKSGRLPALVATSSLELGIDVGAIDLVVQVESPRSVARGLQRVGRSGHLIEATAKGRIVPKSRRDLLEAAVIAREMRRGAVEATTVPTNALDVLAQQVVAMVANDEWCVDDLLAVVRRAYPYRDLSRPQLEAVLEMLAGRYPAEEFATLTARIVWDRANDRVRGRDGARRLATVGGGTIPDRGQFAVVLENGVKLGELEEEFVFESRPGDVFLLGTSTWRIMAIRHDRVIVADAAGAPPRIPFWRGEGLGRPFELGRTIGAFLRESEARLEDPEWESWLADECALDARAAASLRGYLLDQRAATGALPTDRTIVVESFRDELGDPRVIVHAPFGRRVLVPWALALTRRLRQRLGIEVEGLASDDGILFRFPDAQGGPPTDLLDLVGTASVEELLLAELSGSALFGTRFRENAARALLLPAGSPRKRAPLWLQRLKGADLLQVARRYGDFPVTLETYRECLQDVFELDALREVLRQRETGQIRTVVAETVAPSPFAAGLLMEFIAIFMYEGDAPKAERRTQVLGLNRGLLRDLLGRERLRELLDPRAVAELEGRLSGAAPEWRARNADELAELLARVGDLTDDELAARCEPDLPPAPVDAGPGASGADVDRAPASRPGSDWQALLAELRAAHRIVRIAPPGLAPRWVLAEDFARYRDALGLPDDPAVPERLRARRHHPSLARATLVRQFARTHGPFTAAQAAARYGLAEDEVLATLEALEAEGLVVSGSFTAAAAGDEWLLADHLGQLQRRSLALARREIEPAEPAQYARFLLRWQGLAGDGPTGPAGLQTALERLVGLFLPVESWERDLLPRRVPGYRPAWLDQLCAGGEVAWVGWGEEGSPIRVALCPRADLDLLAPPPGRPLSDDAERLRAVLGRRGASFVGELARAAGLGLVATEAALWELARAGLATNDAFEPVRRQAVATGARAPRPGLRPVAREPAPGGPSGRWSLLDLDEPPAPDAALRWARLLLRRWGIVTREQAQAGAGRFTWADLYPVFKQLELAGEVQRGYFVRGLSGAQFALAEAIEALRAARDAPADEAPVLVAALDPANPYGALLPLPRSDGRFARLPGVALALAAGEPLLLIEGGGRRLTPLVELEGERLDAVLRLLPGLLGPGRGPGPLRLVVETWDGRPVTRSPAAARLEALGFLREPDRFVLYRRA